MSPFVWIWNRIQSEPAATGALLRVMLLMAEAFGLHWTAAQMAEVQLFVEMLLAWLTRSATTANINLPAVDIGAGR